MEKVSIIIPCYNMGAYIQRAISSALAQQSQDIAVEVIVVDDGSSDGAFDDATAFSHVRLLRQNNQGSAAARNTGLEIAQGDYLIFLDADDILPRGVVASQLQALTTHPDWDLSVCISLQIQEDTLATYFWPLRAAHLDLHLCHKTITPLHSVFLRKTAATAAGGFNPELRACDDHDFFLRCLRAGQHFGINADTLVLYWLHAGSISRHTPNLARHAAFVCTEIEEILRNAKALSPNGQTLGFQAHAAGCLNTALRLQDIDEKLSHKMQDLSVQAAERAYTHDDSPQDAYLARCRLFFAADFLLRARSLHHPSHTLHTAVRRIRALIPDLARLDKQALQAHCKALDFSLNCPLPQMQACLEGCPEITTFIKNLHATS